MKILFRLIAFPFVLCIILIHSVRIILSQSYNWLRCGGELIPYDKDVKSITMVYDFIRTKMEGSNQ